jgi:hypothetical protein
MTMTSPRPVSGCRAGGGTGASLTFVRRHRVACFFHFSSLYATSMPYAMFFGGGQVVHYSPDFAARGYNGASHGCVNARNPTSSRTRLLTVLLDQGTLRGLVNRLHDFGVDPVYLEAIPS